MSLTANADKSANLTLTTSYITTDPAEVTDNATDVAPPTVPTTYERSHSLLVQFGAGDVRHTFEIDVSEGSSCNAPGHHIDVTLLDYTVSRNDDNALGGPEQGKNMTRSLRSFASISGGVSPVSARLTQKVWAPFQVTVDLADPPNFNDFLGDLQNAMETSVFLID